MDKEKKEFDDAGVEARHIPGAVIVVVGLIAGVCVTVAGLIRALMG